MKKQQQVLSKEDKKAFIKDLIRFIFVLIFLFLLIFGSIACIITCSYYIAKGGDMPHNVFYGIFLTVGLISFVVSTISLVYKIVDWKTTYEIITK